MTLKNMILKISAFFAPCCIGAEPSAKMGEITNSIERIRAEQQKIDSAYSDLSPEEQIIIREKIHEAGIYKQLPRPKPIRPLIIPKKPSPEEAAHPTGIINQEELERVRGSLKPAPVRGPVVPSHLPGKPTPDELQEGIKNLRKTKDITLEMNN